MPVAESMHGAIRQFHRTERRRLYQLLGDGELLSRFLRERDEAAFEEVVSRHGPMVRAVCRRMLGASADADDAFQATFLILVRKARRIRRANLLANWLCAVAYRTSRQAARRRARLGIRERNTHELPEPARTDDPPRDWLPLFDAALQRLPAKYREPVVLCDLQGVPRASAALKLGLNEGTLSSRLGRARDLLRKKLVRHGFPLSVGAALAPITVPEAVAASTVAASIHVGAASVSAVVISEGVMSAMFASKIKAGMACTVVLLAGTVVSWQFFGTTTQAGDPTDKPPPAKELPREPEPKSASSIPVATEPKSSALAAEYQPFQGDWYVTSTQNNGGVQSPSVVGVDDDWTFKGTVLTTGSEAKGDSTEKFTLDPKAKPARIDFTLTRFSTDGTGAIVGTEYQGIYKFEPDGSLTICYRVKADRVLRPTRFATAHNSGATVLTLARPTPPMPPAIDLPMVGSLKETSPPGPVGVTPLVPPPSPPTLTPPQSDVFVPVRPTPADLPPMGPTSVAILPDTERLQGMWVLTLQDGKPADREQSIEILKDRILAGDGHGRIRLDESKAPKQLTLSLTKEPPMTGIYLLENDKLTIATYSRSGKLIPTTFEPDAETGISVSVYERPKEVRPPVVSTPDKIPPGAKPSPQPPKRDLQKEIDQLREQLKQLEKELKERKAGPGDNSN